MATEKRGNLMSSLTEQYLWVMPYLIGFLAIFLLSVIWLAREIDKLNKEEIRQIREESGR